MLSQLPALHAKLCLALSRPASEFIIVAPMRSETSIGFHWFSITLPSSTVYFVTFPLEGLHVLHQTSDSATSL
jgi:hypothetical protein